MAEDRPALRVLASGSRVGGKYELVRRLATGGMGDVWLAQNNTTHANVALKVLRPNRAGTSEAEDRFRREARLSGLLAHRSIVRIFDFLEERDGTLVLVMELLQGETLEQWLARRGALVEREAMAVMAAVLSALQHGHEQGIVHRDVKPSNIFLAVESDGKVIPKLLDYGIAKMPKNDAKTMDGVVLGTPSYMSPEQIRSEEDLDGRSDLFSCGVVLYEVLTGACPFDAPSPSAAIAAVLQSSVDPDPRISPRLWLELQRALAKRPQQRHASAAEMRSTMLGVLAETEDSLAPVLQGVKARDYGAADRTGPCRRALVASGRDAERAGTVRRDEARLDARAKGVDVVALGGARRGRRVCGGDDGHGAGRERRAVAASPERREREERGRGLGATRALRAAFAGGPTGDRHCPAARGDDERRDGAECVARGAPDERARAYGADDAAPSAPPGREAAYAEARRDVARVLIRGRAGSTPAFSPSASIRGRAGSTPAFSPSESISAGFAPGSPPPPLRRTSRSPGGRSPRSRFRSRGAPATPRCAPSPAARARDAPPSAAGWRG